MIKDWRVFKITITINLKLTKDILISPSKLLSPYASDLFIVVTPHIFSFIVMCGILKITWC